MKLYFNPDKNNPMNMADLCKRLIEELGYSYDLTYNVSYTIDAVTGCFKGMVINDDTHFKGTIETTPLLETECNDDHELEDYINNPENDCYDECKTLGNLVYAIDVALDKQNERYEQMDKIGLSRSFSYDQIEIKVGGYKFGFLLGGPQADALYSFANQVADENGHDFNK